MRHSGDFASVLIVDDTRANLIALQAVLQPLDVRLVEASSGRQALARVAQESFAVVLLDVQMPEMDGFEVARRMRATEKGAQVPIIFLTAIPPEAKFVREGYASGAADYITKPYDVDILRARVKAFVDLFHQREAVRCEEVRARTRERDDALERLAALLESEKTARRDAEGANRAKDQFLATMSHELRTPLNAILGWTVLARRQAKDMAMDRPLSIIERNARAQLRIIEDMLDLSRVLSGKLRLEANPVEIAYPVAGAVEAVRLAADAKRVLLVTSVDADIGLVTGDADRLQQVVWNLLSNAIKFTPSGGRVDVTAHRIGARIVIRVQDTGQGIRPEALEPIFETFHQADGSTTRQHGGLGLGLSIARQLVVAHGGTITAHSEGEGKGATFVVELPARHGSGAAGQPGKAAERGAPPGRTQGSTNLDGIRVLVVDDEEDARTLLERVLADRGAEVVCASSSEQALALVDELQPAVVVSDVGMPDFDGYSLVRRMRSKPADRGGRTPAVALTAYASSQDCEEALSAGFQAHLPKPVDIDRLVSVVAALCQGSSAVHAAREPQSREVRTAGSGGQR